MRGTPVIVTGGAGYVGSQTCKALARDGYLPVTYDNLSTGNRWAVQWGPLEIGDINDPNRVHEVFSHYKPVAVMHFAASALVGESMREPAIYWRNNLTGTLHLLDACRVHGIADVVFSSSCAVYGIPTSVPISENEPKLPINPYGASKLAAERVIQDFSMAYGIRYATLRYFNAAGADLQAGLGEARAVETHLIPLALASLTQQGEPLRIFGTTFDTRDGTAVRDYVHVKDLADTHVLALKALSASQSAIVLNLGTGVGSSVREVVDMIETVTGLRVSTVNASPREGDPPALVASAAEATRTFGMSFTNSTLKTIIQDAWDWHAAIRSRS